MDAAAPKQPKENMGEPLPRIDARLKVSGQAHYPADLPVAQIAYGAMATSSIAKGRHGAASRRCPRRAWRARHRHLWRHGPKFGNSGPTSIGPLHDKTIFHDGQIIALAVAETFEAAEEAAQINARRL